MATDGAGDGGGGGQSGESIRVYCRVRPSKRPSGFFSVGSSSSGSSGSTLLEFNLPPDVDRELVNASKTHHRFAFDGAFDMHSGQDEIFDKLAKEAVDSALEGYNSTVFAYGQTGSGKTFTITGGPERYQDRGLIPRSLQRIFAAAKERGDAKYTVYISYLEMYNEVGYDLLDPSQETKALEELPRVTLLEDEDGNVHLRGLSMHMATSEEEALNLLFLGDTNRAIAETPMNQASSRSHCIFTISVESRTEGSPTVKRSKLHLVDLAGSERVHKTNAVGQLFKEATYINKSLHYLELVIVALHEQRKGIRAHIPYRNSIMTSVLRDSLGGNCKTSMIATINPELEHTNESISTCRFAQRVARVQNAATVNEETDPSVVITHLKSKMSALEQEVAYLKSQEGGANGGEASDPPVTDGDVSRITAAARTWVDGPDGQPFNLGTTASYSRIKVAFEALRNIAVEYRKHGGGRGGGVGGARHQHVSSSSSSSSSAESKEGAEDTGNTSSSIAPAIIAERAAETELASALREELKRVKAQLQQRESEIALLVNMVKQLRAGQPIGGTGGGGSSTAAGGQQQQQGSPSRSSTAPQTHAGTNNHTTRPAAPDGITLEATGTFIPASVLNDRDKSFDVFKQLYPKHDSIEDNKILLKQRYDEAKAEAERVNASRNETNRLRAEIERRRVENAMSSISSSSSTTNTGGGDTGGGKQQSSFVDETGAPIDAEEAGLREELETHKVSYKKSFQRLRDLKNEIEHIQRVLEAGRLKMQADFEAWYSDCLMKLNKKTHAEAQRILGNTSSSSGSSGGGSNNNNNNTTTLSAGYTNTHNNTTTLTMNPTNANTTINTTTTTGNSMMMNNNNNSTMLSASTAGGGAPKQLHPQQQQQYPHQHPGTAPGNGMGGGGGGYGMMMMMQPQPPPGSVPGTPYFQNLPPTQSSSSSSNNNKGNNTNNNNNSHMVPNMMMNGGPQQQQPNLMGAYGAYPYPHPHTPFGYPMMGGSTTTPNSGQVGPGAPIPMGAMMHAMPPGSPWTPAGPQGMMMNMPPPLASSSSSSSAYPYFYNNAGGGSGGNGGPPSLLRGLNTAAPGSAGGPPVSTGSAEADADIAAFYKAKEELLRRAKLASQGGGGKVEN